MSPTKSLIVIAIAGTSAIALGDTFKEDPTVGLALPAAPLTGEFDGRAVVTNPAGVAFVRGAEFEFAIDVEDDAFATRPGQGYGAYLAFAGGGKSRFGIGFGFEWLRSPEAVVPEGARTPFRFTLTSAGTIGRLAYGTAWHHFRDDSQLGGVDTLDYGLAMRLGNRAAVGAVGRDLYAQHVGATEPERRYELEVMTRPLATDRFELAVGGRIGEDSRDLDGWGRITARLVRGVIVHGAVETRELHRIVDLGGVSGDMGGRELRATLGLEVSLGGFGVTALVSGVRDDSGKSHALGGQLVSRASSTAIPSLLGRPDHIERVKLSGVIGVRESTELVQRLRAIAGDDSAKGVILVFDNVQAGLATLEELRDGVLALRRAGKRVFAHLVTGTGGEYMLASAADKLYVDPAGGLDLVGMQVTGMYFRNAFDQIGVNPQFAKIAEYKSAPERFTETGPSPSVAEMTNALLDSHFERWLSAVAETRKVTPDQLRAVLDNGPYMGGELAQHKQLVDALVPLDKIEGLVAAELGHKLPVKTLLAERPERWNDPRIAVIYIEGEIRMGKSALALPVPIVGHGKIAGSETLVDAIKAAREDGNIGAIVIRIDSPGGDAIASELIAREVFATRGKKPILCSFGDVAASGGYLVAAGCDTIFAEPTTITGSIGVFGGNFDYSGLMKKLGVTTETFKRGRRADFGGTHRAWTDDERAMVMQKIRLIYDRFVSTVSDGRKLSRQEVDAIGRGHVWTGIQAKQIKLVDELGGLTAALDLAKRRLNFDPKTPVELEELPDLPRDLLGLLGGAFGAKVFGRPLAERALDRLAPLARELPSLDRGTGVQARLPFDVVW